MKTKRFLSALLAVCALVCVVGLTTASVSAATEIEMINFANIPWLEDGAVIESSDLIAVGASENDPYDEAGVYNDCWKTATYRWVNATGEEITTYVLGDTYLETVLVPAEGFVIGEDVLVTVNWSDHGVSYAMTDDGITITWKYAKDTYADGSITIAEPEVGTVIESADPFAVNVTPWNEGEELHYTVSGQWLVYDYEIGEYVPFSGTVEAGHLYRLQLTVKANVGYELRNVDLMVNDEWKHWEDHDREYVCELNYGFVENYINYVRLGALPEAVIGETAANVELEVLEGSAMASASWEVLNFETDMYEPFTGTFEDGKVYRLNVEVKAAEGSVFYGEVSIETEYTGHGAWAEEPTPIITTTWEYSFRPEIEEIVINGVTDAVIGETATVEGITVPEGAPYRVVHAYWSVYTKHEFEMEPGVFETYYGYDDFDGVFEDGKKYRLWLQIELDNEYEFTEGAPIVVNGEEAGYAWGGNFADIQVTCSFQEVIDKIEITVPEAEIGKPVYGEITAGGHYTVHVDWEDDDRNWIKPEGGVVFEDGKRYYLHLNIQPEFGYEFSEDTVLYVNGKEFDDRYWVDAEYCNLEIEVSFVDIVKEIIITNAPEAIVGEKATVDGIKIPENAGYEVHAYWYNETTEEVMEEGAVFEKGNAYILILEVSPLAGYEFDREDTTMTVNGEEEGWVDQNFARAELRYSLLTPIDSIVITGVKDAVIGEKATVEGIKIPEDANYELKAYWVNYTTYEEIEEGTVFEDGAHYALFLEVYPAKGYEFSEDATITVNGEEPVEYGINPDITYVVLDYSFVDLIEKIEITLTEPVVGGTIDLGAIKVPENAHYEIDVENSVIIDAETMEPVTGKYEDGHKYLIGLYIWSKEGYECNGKTVITANGEEVEPYQFDSDGVMIVLEYTFREIIEKVELTDVPEAVVGQKIEEVELTVPKDAPYTVIGTWMVYTEYGYEPAEGKFQDGKVYHLELNIVAKEGYELSAETTVITINGETYLGNARTETFGNTLDASVNYVLGLKVIEKIELTIPELVVGGKLPTVKDMIATEGVSVDYLYWFSSKTDDANEYSPARGAVKDGLYYACRVDFIPEDGYVFADNLVLVVNGETVDVEENYGSVDVYRAGCVLFSGMACDHVAGEHEHNGAGHWTTCTKCGETMTEGEHVYTDDKDASCNTCGYEREIKNPDPNPDTGDSFAPVVVLMMLISLASVVVLNKRKFF